jgi:VWFA-related protein
MRLPFYSAVLALLSLATPLAMAQQAPAPKPPQQATIVANVNTVPLTFLALDKKGHFVPGLKASQIQIYDNGRPQNIQKFDSEGNLPLRIALLVDISNSIRDRWTFEEQAAIDFLQSVLVEGRDQAMVVGFDTTAHVTQGFTDNYDKLAHAVRILSPGGGTALYDTLYQVAHDDLGPASRAPGEARNVVVIISDGADDQSRYSMQEALAMAQDAGAVIYTIGTEPTGLDPQNDDILKKFAEQTGGRSFFPIEAHDLGTAFQSILTDLRHQYVVAYSPNDLKPNGAFHTVEIKILVKGVIARTRKGYFAPQALP